MPVITTVPEPTKQDIDEIIRGLKETWKATITIRRQSREDVGYREVILLLDGEHIGILYSMLAFFIGFLGAGPLYLTFKREDLTGA